MYSPFERRRKGVTKSVYSVVTKRWGLSVAGHGEISRKEGTGLWIEAPNSYPL